MAARRKKTTAGWKTAEIKEKDFMDWNHEVREKMAKILRKVKNAIASPGKVVLYLFGKYPKVFAHLPDKIYLKILYRVKCGRTLDLEHPQGFNEKLQYLKLYDRKPIYTTMVDKYAVKDYVAKRIGDEYVIPTLGVWNTFDEIDFDCLPDQFVLKSTHDSGGVVACRNKKELDMEKARAKINRSMNRQYYYNGREWPYKNVKPQIIAEEFVEDQQAEVLPVYKIFCFNGKAKLIQSIQNDKTPDETVDYFDLNWNQMPFKQNFPNSKNPRKQPSKLAEMISCAEVLTAGIPFLRADFYQAGEKVYFSELTFYSDSGTASFEPAEWDAILGSWITLPEKI